jgi:hypothetical protein
VNVVGNVDCDSLNNAGISTFRDDVSFKGAANDALWNETNSAFELNDNVKIKIGSGADFIIQHDGSNSYIENSTGYIYVKGDNISLAAKSVGENYLVANVNDGVDLYFNGSKKAETVTGGFTVTGTCTATAFAGDGSALTGLAAGGGEFNTSISEYATYALTTSMATAFTANSSSSHRTIIHSVRVTNISASEVTVSGALYGSYKFAYLIPIPAGSSVELLKKPKVMVASQIIELQASSGSALQATISAERQENTDLSNNALESTNTSATDLVTMSAAGVFESILCTNDDGTNDVKATVAWTNGSNTVQAYLSYELIIPAGASVELLERPLAMPSGHKLRVTANQANRLVTICAYKVAS